MTALQSHLLHRDSSVEHLGDVLDKNEGLPFELVGGRSQ